MKSIKTTWEDEENNRQIHFSVRYELKNESVEITHVTPEKVSIVCPVSNTVERTMGVHTEKGRQHLASKLISARAEQLKASIADREASQAGAICV